MPAAQSPPSSTRLLLLPNSPNLYSNFDAVHFDGLHLKVDTWRESKHVRKGSLEDGPRHPRGRGHFDFM